MPSDNNIEPRYSDDSFEMSYNPLPEKKTYNSTGESTQRRFNRRNRIQHEPTPAHQTETQSYQSDYNQESEDISEQPVEKSAASLKAKNKNRKEKREKENTKSFSTLFSDSRISIFIGVVLILFAAYALICGISFILQGNPDQSIIDNNSLAELSLRANEVQNAGGPVGASLANFFFSRWLGIGSFIIIAYLILISISLLRIRRCKFWSLTFKSLVSALALSTIAGTLSASSSHYWHWGGESGNFIYHFLKTNTQIWGVIFVNIILLTALILIFYNTLHKGFVIMMDILNKYRLQRRERIESEVETGYEFDNETPENEPVISDAPASSTTEPDKKHEEFQPVEETEIESSLQPDFHNVADDSNTESIDSNTAETTEMEIQTFSPIEEVKKITTDTFDPTAELSRYKLPPVSLLKEKDQKGVSIDQEEQEQNKERITRTLNSYGIEIASISATIGPTITLYEIIPAEGVRINKIKNLGNDMALSLSALGIRIIAPIPGKGTIGMEVPNREKQIVSIRSILSSPAYQNSTAALPIAMGTTIQNEVYVTDLAKMPHLLVAGATGMGKSVGLNTIIASLLYKKHPAELKFVMVDPKMVEFSLYATLERHFLAKLPGEEDAIITDPSKVVATLNSLCVEMDNRYALLRQASVRDLKAYNEKFVQRRLNPENGHKFLPHIVVIIDEFADLMLTAGKEVEAPISRIAAKARAVGIHMILATQRPSVNVITGTIKANFPGRIAFRVNQMNDSRTILDRPGADQLIGRGDMIISKDGVMERVQCALIKTEEVEAICQYISNQMGYDSAYELPEYIPENEGGGAYEASGPRDPLFAEAGSFIVNSGFGSTTSIQRHFNVGYPRAGKIMDQLEAAGVVGPSTGGKPRKVLMDPTSFANFMQSL